jgi:Domain of unknown function (DUF4411)
MAEDVFCIDDSSLMELTRQYPRGRFPSLWQRVEGLVEIGRLIAPKEVHKEIQQGDDSLVAWAKKMSKMFKPLDSDQAKRVSEVLAECPALIDPMSETPQADPFLIALAKDGNEAQTEVLLKTKHVVVTQEGKNKPNKIPQLCTRLGIECIRLLDMFEREGWEF